MRQRLFRHGEIDSTSERAFADIAAGSARHGDVHVATAQTAGRGRLGRTWSSPPGEGLYTSLVLLPPPPVWSSSALTMAAGLAVHDAAVALGVRGARLKWPNDLVVDGLAGDGRGGGGLAGGEAKLAGVIVETRGLDPAGPHYVVGVGMNVRQREFPPELLAERAVASLANLGLDVEVERAFEAVLAALDRRVVRLQRGEPWDSELARDYLRATALHGARVRVRVGEAEHEGVLEDLSVDGGLRLVEKDGSAHRFPLEIVRAVATSL